MPVPTRAVRLIPIGETPDVATLGAEQVAAYRLLQDMTSIVRQIAKAPVNRRNAATEAASRLYAANNFR
jgi:hypothetical protein